MREGARRYYDDRATRRNARGPWRDGAVMSIPYGNPVVRFRTPAPILRELEARRGDAESTGEVARRDLQRYYAMVALELSRIDLSAAEAALICDALASSDLRTGSIHEDASLLRSWWIRIEDHLRLTDAARRWGVADPAALVERCRTLPPGASAAVLDAVRRWHLRASPAGESLAESLQAVGLIREAD